MAWEQIAMQQAQQQGKEGGSGFPKWVQSVWATVFGQRNSTNQLAHVYPAQYTNTGFYLIIAVALVVIAVTAYALFKAK